MRNSNRGLGQISILLFPILLLGGCAWGGNNLPQIMIQDKNKNFDFPVGQQFQVVLPSNQSTGYQWQVDDITTGILERVNNEYQVTESNENIVGAGGQEVWTFKVLQTERSHIVMKYRRPWNKLDVANDFLVTINGNPGDDNFLTFKGKIETGGAGCFVTEDGQRLSLVPYAINHIEDPGVRAGINEFSGKDQTVEIHGELGETMDPTCNGLQFIVHEIKGK